MNDLATRFERSTDWREADIAPAYWLPPESPLAMPRQTLDETAEAAETYKPATSPTHIAARRLAVFGGAAFLAALVAIGPFILLRRGGYGGLETLVSYGVPLHALPTNGASIVELREALHAAVPAAHVDFMRNCTLSHCEDDYVFVHAGVRPGRPLAMQQRNDLLWIREDFLRATSPLPGKVVVHGHTICDVPQDLGYRIDIDTGAFVSGRLTCLVAEGADWSFLHT